MTEQAWIQDGGHGQSYAPSHFLQTPHPHAAEPGSWTLLGKILGAQAEHRGGGASSQTGGC